MQLGVLLLIQGKNVVSVYSGKFNSSIIVVFLLAFLGIAFWLRISRILEPYLKDSKILSYISDNTFDIMMHHAFILKVFVGIIFGILTVLHMDIAKNFNLSLYRKEIWYSPLLYGKSFFSNVYLLVGLALPCFFAVYYKKVKKFIKGKFKYE